MPVEIWAVGFPEQIYQSLLDCGANREAKLRKVRHFDTLGIFMDTYLPMYLKSGGRSGGIRSGKGRREPSIPSRHLSSLRECREYAFRS